MFITPHVLVGASIAVSTGSYPLAIIGGVASHFLLDTIPHTDWGTWHSYKKDFKVMKLDYISLTIDIIFALAVFIWLVAIKKFQFWLIFTAFASSSILDIYALDYVFNLPFKFRNLPVLKSIYLFLNKTHFKLKIEYWPLGLLTQILVIAGGIWFLQGY